MNITEITDALDGLPLGFSSYEFENFYLESYPTSARQLVAVMQEIERLHAEQLKLKTKLDETTCEGDRMLLSRQLKTIKVKYDQLVFWYNEIDPDLRTAIMNSLDVQEPDYWANYLGRQAAIELLTLGRTSREVMDKMAQLPVEAFEESVRICVRYANLIKETTASVEQSMGVSVSGVPNG